MSESAKHKKELTADESHKKGCVTKCVSSAWKKDHGSYRRNGYEETKGNPLKVARYKPLPMRIELFGLPGPEQLIGGAAGAVRTPADPIDNPGAWDFVGKNFKNARLPYAHMYHHMVPWDVMSQTFKLRELKLIQGTGYNLNEGFNLIILPCTHQTAVTLGLYSHPNDHPTYSNELGTMLRAVKNEITGDSEEHLDKEQVGGIRSVLESWEKAEWFKIAAAGWEALGAHINEYKPSNLADVARAALGA